jgi:hypothetical protein
MKSEQTGRTKIDQRSTVPNPPTPFRSDVSLNRRGETIRCSFVSAERGPVPNFRPKISISPSFVGWCHCKFTINHEKLFEGHVLSGRKWMQTRIRGFSPHSTCKWFWNEPPAEIRRRMYSSNLPLTSVMCESEQTSRKRARKQRHQARNDPKDKTRSPHRNILIKQRGQQTRSPPGKPKHNIKNTTHESRRTAAILCASPRQRNKYQEE